MDMGAVKLLLSPLLVGAASLAGRRWGPAVSGWLIALPLTSGPIVYVLALDQGPPFARAAALGMLSGSVSQALFCLAFGGTIRRVPWPLASGAGALAFAASTGVFRLLTPPAGLLYLIVVAVVFGVLRLLPPSSGGPEVPRTPPVWDIPVRMIIAVSFVGGLTAAAPSLGPRLTGLISPFPIITLILASFASRLDGAPAALKVLKGLLLGLFSTSVFFLVLAVLVVREIPLGVVFAAASAATLAMQGGMLRLVRRFLS